MSVPKPLVRSGLRLVRPMLDSTSVALGTKRSIVDRVVSLSRAPEGHIYDFDTLAGMSIQYVTMDSASHQSGASTILYLHGGGTVAGSARAYRAFAANLAQSIHSRQRTRTQQHSMRWSRCTANFPSTALSTNRSSSQVIRPEQA